MEQLLKIKFIKEIENHKIGEIYETKQLHATQLVKEKYAEWVDAVPLRLMETIEEIRSGKAGPPRPYPGEESNIPDKLQDPDFKFILLGNYKEWIHNKTKEKKIIDKELSIEELDKLKDEGWMCKGKMPIEPGWPTTANYSYNNLKILNHKDNIGMLGGKVVPLDCDSQELIDWVEEKLPKTYTQQGRRDRKTYFFRCDETKKIPLVKNINGVQVHYGELQGEGSQVVIPPSIHPSGLSYQVVRDLNITFLEKKLLDELKEKFLDKGMEKAIKIKAESDKISDIETKINLINVFAQRIPELKNYERSYWQGTHPIHGSDTGANLYLDLVNNRWHCFRCDSGGGVASAIAMIDLNVSCEKLTGALDKETYKKVLKQAEIKYGYKEIKTENTEDSISSDISFFKDKLHAANLFCGKHPIYFDFAKNWWKWDSEEYRWTRKDDIDILNIVKKYPKSDIIKSQERNEIINALKSIGREIAPLTPSREVVQFKDKIINIKTLEEGIATPKYFFANPIPWKIGSSEDTPTIDKLFRSWVEEDKVKMLYEILAYSILPDMPINLAILLFGKGRNGKDQYVKILKRFLDGNDFMNTDEKKSESKRNCVAMSLDELGDKFTTSRLYKKLMVEIGEIDNSIFKHTATWKAITGGSGISGQFKGKDSFTFTSYAKPFIHTNIVPETKDESDGFYRRFLVIRFNNRFEGAIDIKDVYKTIPDEEFENLAKKSITLLRELLERGRFTGEPTDEEKKEDYIAVSSPLGKFIDEECIIGENYECKKEIFANAYRIWCEEEGTLRQGDKSLTIALKKWGYRVMQTKRTINGKTEEMSIIIGLKLKNSCEPSNNFVNMEDIT